MASSLRLNALMEARLEYGVGLGHGLYALNAALAAATIC